MNRLRFKKGSLKKFISQIEEKTGLDSEELGKSIGVSGRTIRAWRIEKYYPDEMSVLELSKISNVSIPPHTLVNQYWYAKKGASLGGKRTFELYGPIGTESGRRKGGTTSWQRRRANPELLKKYTTQFLVPSESVDLAEFIGIMLGDGGITKYQATITLHKFLDRGMISYVRKLGRRLFGVTPSEYSHTDTVNLNVKTVCFSGVNLVNSLVTLGLKVGNKVQQQVSVPDWVLKNPEYRIACLRGLIDTDGCVYTHTYTVNTKKYSYKKIAFTNRSMPLLKFVYDTWKELGLNPSVIKNIDVRLNSRGDVQTHMKVVGTHNPKHLKRFRN